MKHTAITPELYSYLLDTSIREHPVLKELGDYTATMELAQMKTPSEQIQFMQLLLRLLKAENVLEIGTFTGYSALGMALALPEHGQLITCDRNAEWTAKAQSFWDKAGLGDKITLRLGQALDTLQELMEEGFEQQFDFIFIDADKTNYRNYYEMALKLIKPQGLIAIDNIFWDGKVIDSKDQTGQTKEIRKLNALLKQDKRVFISLLPIADGLFLVQPVSGANES